MRKALPAIAIAAFTLVFSGPVGAAGWPAPPGDGAASLVLPVRGGPGGHGGGGGRGPGGGFRDAEFRDGGFRDGGYGNGGYRPPPPPPPPPPLPPARLGAFEPPPPFLPGGDAYRDRPDSANDDPGNFKPPAWLDEWIRVARQRGYSDEELALILSRHPRLGRFIERSRARGFSDRAIYVAMGLDQWQGERSSSGQQVAAPLPPAKVAAVPVSPPVVASVQLELAESFSTSDPEVEIRGRLTGSTKGATVMVDGAQVPLAKDGSFSYRRGVPIGDTEIKVEARDRQGRAASRLVTASRDMAPVAVSSYEPLDPRRLKGKANAKAVALIIGIDHYEAAPRAEFAENDANAFYDYATRALGVPAARVKLLTGPKARRLAVEKAVLAWAQPLVAQGESDVYVFFSGHGLASDDGRDQYLLPYDGEQIVLAQSALRRKDLINALVGAGARSVTLFLDTCYSGGTRGSATLVQAARPLLIAAKEEDVPANVTILAAAARDQLSSSLAGARHGLFSYFLMKGLEGKAAEGMVAEGKMAEGGNVITAAQLQAYLARQVPGEAAMLGRAQTPELLGDAERVLVRW